MAKRHLTPDDDMGSLLQHRLTQVTAPAASPAGEVCADAETLASYVDDGMSASERADWEAHFAACTKCRRSLALMARLKETASPDWHGETSRDTATSGSLWFWMPLAACVLVGAGLWFATRPVDRGIGSGATTVTRQARADSARGEIAGQTPAPQAPAPATPPKAAGSTSPTAPGAGAAVTAVTEATPKPERPAPLRDARADRNAHADPVDKDAVQRREAETRARTAEAEATLAARAPASAGKPASGLVIEEAKAKAEEPLAAGGLRRQPLGARSPGASIESNEKNAPKRSSAPSTQNAANRQLPSGPNPQQAAQQQAPAPAPAAPAAAPEVPVAAPQVPAAESVAVAGAARKALENTDKAVKKSADNERDTLAPAERANGMLAIVMDPATPTRRWRVFRFGNIEVSRDGGGTWANELRQPDVTFLAIVSPAPGECWVVGTKGSVWHLALDSSGRGSGNGKVNANANPRIARAYADLDTTSSWQARQVSTPEDLVSVTASNGLSAVVTTRSGVQFATTNGGKSWTRK